jgi:hypothetical protein
MQGLIIRIVHESCAVGIDDLLSRHIAHLFIRDPIVVFSELLDQDDSKSTDHFEVCFDLATLFAYIGANIDVRMHRISNLPTGKP